MGALDDDRVTPGGGRATSSGSFHFSCRSGSRATGASARSAFDYVTRDGAYADRDLDPLVATESGHMPDWATDDPGAYWDAADRYERANGRLYVSADFALPRELSTADQEDLVRNFVTELTADESLPYTWAIHAGRDEEGRAHNPHAHLLLSERGHDGHDRSPAAWFARAHPTDAARGGSRKSRQIHGQAWMERARERWATQTNRALLKAGVERQVDHRSYQRQGIDREPGTHYGPAAGHMLNRGEPHDRLETSAAERDGQDRLREIDQEIADLTGQRHATLQRLTDALEHDHSAPDQRPNRDDESGWSR